ncbi:GFA family protein [Aureimonas phyllosphaerae]|uniref:CENP-V/GFA domain-containing protein n=1 Tax=Aureimonas phyllosphaerae TaxID=1166078 RepID=A0A7W6BME3_9HYPH|nr:GFA family protein [Aureimonas phyllosphaerae]MBB3934566.1 hypothetical protein [Aureimonas phyllosphaerae]MBB3958218.1 hypothetical protein [Aureimonas phyllosphaerae]SFE93748.1 Uncharacterized conserved protein [Aureimonas phyllosphaerae]
MTLQAEPSHTGGCQCGAVRFRIHGKIGRASVCHCRMCQKAFGGLYAPLVNLGAAEIVWTKREPKRFRSSNQVSRGFCPECGTPLTYEAPDGVALAIGVFDDPSVLAPQIQFGIEGKLPYVDGIAHLPVRSSAEDAGGDSYLADIVSYQHPDREMPGEASGDTRHP